MISIREASLKIDDKVFEADEDNDPLASEWRAGKWWSALGLVTLLPARAEGATALVLECSVDSLRTFCHAVLIHHCSGRNLYDLPWSLPTIQYVAATRTSRTKVSPGQCLPTWLRGNMHKAATCSSPER